jgi:hypothetical protein
MFTTAVANPEFFNALMAHACADFEVQQTKVVAKTPSPKVLFFQGESFKALSRKLSKCGGTVDVSAVLAVLMLMGMDVGSPPPQYCTTMTDDPSSRLRTEMHNRC